jgi:hypothetical protein
MLNSSNISEAQMEGLNVRKALRKVHINLSVKIMEDWGCGSNDREHA